MKKILKGALFGILLSCLMITNAFAVADASRLVSSMRALGIADTYIGNMVEYLQSINMSSSQESQLMAYVNQAEAIAGGQSDLTTLPVEKKAQLKVIAQEAAAVVGLNASFGRDESGKAILVLTKSNGSILLVLNSENAKNVNFSLIRTTISEAGTFSRSAAGSSSKSGSSTPAKSGSSAKYKPISGGKYSKTATNTMNSLLAGAGLICASGAVLVLRKKSKVCLN